MRILHYCLGFPPYRSGGLTNYAVDLAKRQSTSNDVFVLWPGRFSIFRNVHFRKRKITNQLTSIEMINPIPVPLVQGIKDIENFLLHTEINVFLSFFLSIKPDVIHVHTFQGIYPEFFEAAKKNGIRIIYTTHDYFGLCPKLSLFFQGKSCSPSDNFARCPLCNKNALSKNSIILLQSSIYRGLKNTWIMKRLRSFQKHKLSENTIEANENHLNDSSAYVVLKNYYKKMFDSVDEFHFNSEVSAAVFKTYIPHCKGQVIPISQSKILDSRRIHPYNGEHKLEILFIGPCTEAKGFFFLIDVLDTINLKHPDRFTLRVFNPVALSRSYLKIEQSFKRNELDKVFSTANLLIMPSLWFETFGFVCQEALCFGVPVLVSKNVGAKCILNFAPEMIFSDRNDLLQKIEKILSGDINLTILSKMVCDRNFSEIAPSIDEVEKLYKRR